MGFFFTSKLLMRPNLWPIAHTQEKPHIPISTTLIFPLSTVHILIIGHNPYPKNKLSKSDVDSGKNDGLRAEPTAAGTHFLQQLGYRHCLKL